MHAISSNVVVSLCQYWNAAPELKNSHKPHNFLDAERLALIRQQRADAAKKREEEKAGTSLSLSCFMHVSIWPHAYKFYINIYI